MLPAALRARLSRAVLALFALVLPAISCAPRERPLLPRSQTWAELRTIRRGVTVKPPDERERSPHPRERLVDGAIVHVAAEGLAWLRRDGGATLLVRGPADLTLRAESVELRAGRVFVDTPSERVVVIDTPAGPLHLAHVRASLDVGKDAAEVYVLAGEVRAEGAAGDPQKRSGSAHAGAGERLTLTGGKEARAVTAPVLAWEDWTGGLATTDRTAEPSPYGVGTVGARRPGDTGAPHFPLAIQKLDVRVTVDQDFAITEVDEIFFNPSSETVEGVYRFRTPDGATLSRFGVDREGVIKWGRVKEKQAAAAQYQANVYRGSTEDPALLEWDAPGVYRARLYPIGPGETRRVVVTYAEWLPRTGEKHERRLYVYPMAADGAEESLPHVEELYATIDLARAGAKDVRAGMAGVRGGDTLVVRAHDFVPRADLAVELFDDGPSTWRGYRAPHVVDAETLPPSERSEAMRKARTEAEYVLVPVWDGDVAGNAGNGLDLAIVVDTSAATEPAALAIARAATGALLAHLGKDDRAVVWAGDSSLRPVVPGRDKLAPIDEAARRDVLARLAGTPRGGATDLGAMLAAAAARLDDPTRRGAVVYIGDGAPTVGELSLVDLRDRLDKLPRPVRLFGLGVGDGADMAILKGLARGAFAERVGDANAAARAALRLLEAAERPARLGASVDLGPTVERVFPRDLGAVVEGNGQVVVGRLTGAAPVSMTVKSPAGEKRVPIRVGAIDDHGDLRRRWAEGRLSQMIDEGVGRAAMVDLGTRNGIITPVTSLYVPTKNEMTAEERNELEVALAQRRRTMQKLPSKYDGASSGRRVRRDYNPTTGEEQAKVEYDREEGESNKEGGTGARAKGEEGSMGGPQRRASNTRFATKGAADDGNYFGSPIDGAKVPAQAAATAVAAPSAQAAAPSAAPTPIGGVAGNDKADADGRPAATEIPRVPDAKPAAPGRLSGRHREKAAADGFVTALPSGSSAPTTAVTGKAAPGDPLAGEWANNTPPPDEAETTIALSGIGEGGGGRGEGIGLGSIGTLGHGATRQQATGGDVSGLDQKLANAKDEAQADVMRKVLAKSALKNSENQPAFRGTEIIVRIGDVPHAARRCGGAAALPLEERVALWRERLAAVAGNPHAVAQVYRRALAACEAPTYRERSRLLSMLLDALPRVVDRVALWRIMFGDLGAADALYRGILARVRAPAELRALHDALGLRTIDPGVLAKLLKEAKTPGERVTKLRGLAAQWPDDHALALKLLDALEDAGDDSGARELGRALRARPDAGARVRIAVGELYLRLAARAADAAQKAELEGEARRAFGEIVEFAPDDPIARRTIGDLLRAHGWYAEAARQYETLARLTPDDAGVPLLLAAAAQGQGRLEEAVKWTEKGGAAGAPDAEQSAARTARAFAATYLAWGRVEALAGGRKDEAEALAARLARVRSTERTAAESLRGTRATLVWAHPELHPTLWTNALGAAMPAPEGDVTLGVAAATVPDRDGAFVEVRVEPDEVEHAARLGAEATLTVVFDEGGAGEKIVRTRVTFARGGPPIRRFSLSSHDVTEVSR
ncbi:MAG: VIT domain-containing protein [Minicystis sp.]